MTLLLCVVSVCLIRLSASGFHCGLDPHRFDRVEPCRCLLEVRSWEPISKSQSWSHGEVGKQAHLHCSKCLDEWHDARGVSLKFQARCGALWWRQNTARFFALEQHEG
eukprot:9792377-Prorocentrum_lima.AAC.1